MQQLWWRWHKNYDVSQVLIMQSNHTSTIFKFRENVYLETLPQWRKPNVKVFSKLVNNLSTYGSFEHPKSKILISKPIKEVEEITVLAHINLQGNNYIKSLLFVRRIVFKFPKYLWIYLYISVNSFYQTRRSGKKIEVLQTQTL